jgi:hypothetical protein
VPGGDVERPARAVDGDESNGYPVVENGLE